jgi:hypothetical protein
MEDKKVRKTTFKRFKNIESSVCFHCYGELEYIGESGYENGKHKGYCNKCQMYTFFDVKYKESNKDEK